MRAHLLLLTTICLVAPQPSVAQEVLVQDPLAQATTGRQDGAGEFLPDGGWRSQGGFIVFDAGRVLEDGYFEATMRGWTPPGQGIDKSHPLSGWELEDQYTHYAQMGSFWNWRIGTGYFPFKVLAAPRTIETRVEARVGDVNALPDQGPHRYRVEWRAGTVRFLFDGQLLREWAFDRFALRYFLVGKDEQYGITNPAPIISDVVVADRTPAVGPMPEPEPEPEPEPGTETFTVRLSPTQDTFAHPESPSAPQGALDNLQVGGDGQGAQGRTIYLQFDLGRAQGTIEDATLRLRATNGGLAGHVRSVDSDDWEENRLTWQNRPAVGGSVFARLNGVAAGMVYEWPLNGPFPQGRPLWSLAITSTEDDGAAFASKEHSDAETRPELVLRIRRGASSVDMGRDLDVPMDAGQGPSDARTAQPPVDAGLLATDAASEGGASPVANRPDLSAGPPAARTDAPQTGAPTIGGCITSPTGVANDRQVMTLLTCLLLLAIRLRRRAPYKAGGFHLRT